MELRSFKALGMNSMDIAATIGDINITHASVTSFNRGSLVDSDAMRVLVRLNEERDERICEAHFSVNAFKVGYIKRERSYYIKSEYADILMSPSKVGIRDLVRHSCFLSLLDDELFVQSYRVIFPYFLESTKQWLLVSIYCTTRDVKIVSAECTNSVSSVTTAERKIFQDRLTILLNALDQKKRIGGEDLPSPWIFSFGVSVAGLPCKIDRISDSGVFIAYAMECDYFDVPMFAEEIDWDGIRSNFVYWILNKELPM